MNILVKDDNLLKKYNDICNKVSNRMKNELDCESIYNKNFLKTKIRSNGEAIGFHTIKIPEAVFDYICWLMILINSVLKKDENYYPQVFLKECKYIEKGKKCD